MTQNDFTYKSQDVNYLGFLEAQLRDLTGIDILTYELIQNADDVQGENGRSPTTNLSFDITDEALIVKNNGVFRPVDFERLQNLAGGGKREEVGTTGAFGIGFVAVYQITDAPEIYSNNIHWTIQPDAAPAQRIQERQEKTQGTCFRLPWAFDARSPVRRALRIEAIQADQLDSLADTIAVATEVAALFLQQLQVLEVKRNGRLIQRIERLTPAPDEIVLQGLNSTTTWLLMQGDFAAEAIQLRTQYPWQIEEKRRSDVRIAVRASGLDQQGRLFAVLPTESTTPLPLHINADFYPTTDRKRIHFGSDYQSEWNRAAIRCAANVIANQFDSLPQQLGPFDFWDLLQKMAYTQQLANEGELPDVFAAFWQTVAPTLHNKPILFTADDQWLLPADVRLPGRGVRETAVSLLNSLKIPILHPDLNPHSQLMRQSEIRAVDLSIQDVTDALKQAGLVRSMPLFEAPLFLRSVDALQTLWNLIDRLLINVLHPQEREAALNMLQRCSLVLSEVMTLEQSNHVFRGKSEAKTLFPDALWVHEAVSENRFPGQFVNNFGVRQAVNQLVDIPLDQLEYEWRMERLDVPGIFRWFESNQIEIFADDPTLQQDIRRLPLVPVNGELRPLSHLYIPGGFEDPLKLSGTVDLDLIGGRPQFLRDLGVQELDFETYVYEQLPRVLTQHLDIPSDGRHRLLQLLAERLGEFRDDRELQSQLSDLPLIACLDGSFRAANNAFASRDVERLLGTQVHIAEPVDSESIRALYRWLGVRNEPTAADIVQSLLFVSQTNTDAPLDEPTQHLVQQCLLQLNGLLVEGTVARTDLSPLQGKKAFPNRKGRLVEPSSLFSVDDAALVNQFSDLDDHLLMSGDGVGEITAVFNIKPLSQAVKLHIVDGLNAVEAMSIQKQIANRRPLIDRLLQAEMKPGEKSFNAAFLANVRVLKLPELNIQYWLTIDGRTLKTEPEAVSVKFDSAVNILYLEDIPSWAMISRELAIAIKGSRAVGGLAIGIKEVLSADTFGKASRILDELGYM